MITTKFVVATTTTPIDELHEEVRLEVLPVTPPQPNIPVHLWADAVHVLSQALGEETTEDMADLEAEWVLAWANAKLNARWEGLARFELLTPEQFRQEIDRAKKSGPGYAPKVREQKRFAFLAKKSKELVDQILADLYGK